MKKIVIANWKMNGSGSFAASLATNIVQHAQNNNCKIVLCPPYVYLPHVSICLESSDIALGAQDCYPGKQGAVTGAIDATMLCDLNCSYVIVGHSERRTLFNESNEQIAAKFFSAASTGLIPILCVGETKQQRDQEKTFSIIKEQLNAVTNNKDNKLPENFIIAYEPVWAIGTGEVATPELANEVHSYIKSLLPNNIKILYGGSVKATNSAQLVAMSNIDGFLVGGASLNSDEFCKICS